MQTYQKPDSSLWAFEDDGSQDDLITDDMVLLTAVQVTAIQNLVPTSAQLWSSYQSTAQDALDKSDVTILRCTENSVAIPTAWATYRAALRTIVRSTTGDATLPLPTRPTYPSGT